MPGNVGSVVFAINGKRHAINVNGGDVSPSTTLYDYLRQGTSCTGTKLGCGEGGCGACSVEVYTQATEKDSVKVTCINSCLAPIGTMDGSSIITVEGLGDCTKGFHPVQETIAAFHGSQCGFCTPGMVVACHAAVAKARAAGGEPGPEAMEKALDGNLCRCTGYRPILDACKSFAKGVDIEELGLRDSDALPGKGAAPMALPEELTMPAWLRAYNKQKAENAGAAAAAGGESTRWAAPTSLAQLLELLKAGGGGSGARGGPKQAPGRPRLVAGNTGAGVYKDWPTGEERLVDVTRVPELRVLRRGPDGGMVVGAAVTQEELIDTLLRSCSADTQQETPAGSEHAPPGAASQAAGAKGGASLGLWWLLGYKGEVAEAEVDPSLVWRPLAQHLQRIAGSQVRAAGTLGGNLVLTRARGLESDVATLLMAAGAEVETVKAGSKPAWRSVESFMGAPACADSGPVEVITSIRLPPVRSSERFWSFKVAERHWNAHAFINIAVWLSVDGSGSSGNKTAAIITDARVVFGYPAAQDGAKERWQVGRARAVEKALIGAPSSVSTLAAAVAAVPEDVVPGEVADAAFLLSAGQGLLFEALAALLKPVGVEASKELPEHVLEVPSLHEVPLSRGTQDLPDFARPGSAAGAPIMKERALLQASGEAIYAADTLKEPGCLHAAFVASTEPLAVLKGVDAGPALALPGVVAYFGAGDIPGTNKSGDAEELFATDKVEWVGQPIGLIVAESRALADRAASLVKVEYSRELGPPIMTIDEARKAGAFHEIPPLPGANSNLPEGVDSALGAVAASPLQIRGAKWYIPNQVHMYMEPQTSVARWDEGGVIQVHSATQGTDYVQWAVARVLGLPHNRVNVTCRRLGGGFGGKSMRSCPPAAAVALAAFKLRRQVQLPVNRNQDFAMNAGRAAVEVEYDIGFEADGKLRAVEMQAYLMGGALREGSSIDLFQLKGNVDQAYDIPAFHFDLHLCRTNRPPHTAVRGPGEIQAAMLAEHLLEHVAARLGADPAIIRERNFLRVPGAPANGGPATVRTALGQEVPAELYTLQRIWKQVKEGARYEERRAEIDAFNARHPWVKRGISMTHCRFRSMVPPRPGIVSIFADGSVIVTCAGAEMGQGMFTKVKQVAIHELSKALPEDQRPLPLERVEVNDNATFYLPNAGITGGSTAAEGSCEAVRLACKQLVEETLKPAAAAKNGEKWTWEGLVGEIHTWGPFPPASKLTAYALYDGTECDKPGGGKKLQYSTFGAACTEVEVNLLTGERRVLRADVLHDAGRSISPAVDMGQVEGGWVLGMGMMLQERADYSPQGQPLYNSTWTYKIPAASCIPRVFNIGLLADSPNKHGVMGSKSVGEPPLLLSASVLSAFQAAVGAAKEGLAAREPPASAAAANADGGSEGVSAREAAVQQLCAPVTVKNVRAAVGDLRLPEYLAQFA